ncbi:MAG: hypothetical protein FD174_1622 [Geobacteraceae bacterium]|nr:MAG: hypothetical protein FD174_1622 [Geobacteraceae bacterium]
MTKLISSSLSLVATCLLAATLAACGGGGGSATAPHPASSVTVAGIAATGAPLSGTVKLSDSSYPTKTASAQINQDGTFSLNVDGLKAPFILMAVDASGNSWYSFAKEPGVANINPLSNLAVAVAAGATDMRALADLYADHNIADMQGIANTIPRAFTDITSSLGPLLSLYGAASSDPLVSPYTVNKQGLDGLFDQVAINISEGKVSVTRKDTQVTIFSAPVGNITSGAVDTASMPIPSHYYMPGNAVLTLKLQGDLPQGTLVKNISISVRLPYGITVLTTAAEGNAKVYAPSCSQCHPYDTTKPDNISTLYGSNLPALFKTPHQGVTLSSDQLDILTAYFESLTNPQQALTADVNTAIPIGAATGSNVYPAPSLSATNNILNITMSSLTGFGTGDFITIRCIAPSPSLVTATTAASFSVTASSFYSDIYKNQKLKGLAVVPTALVYPIMEGKQDYDSLCAGCHTLDPSDSVITPTLYDKTALLPGIFKTAHHRVTLTAGQLDNLTAYLDAYYLGQQIPVPAE